MATNEFGLQFPLPALGLPDDRPYTDIDEGPAIDEAIVDTIRAPLLVLDDNLRVVRANRSFYQTFNMCRQDVQGRPVYALGDGLWNIAGLRLRLENIAAQDTVMDAYEVELELSGVGRRTMLLNARRLLCEDDLHATILLVIEDITERRANERDLKELLLHREVLIQEMRHRVANSLQIIASVLLLKARTVRSDELRLCLQDAHQRVISIAAIQNQLQATEPSAMIEVAPYLTRLCETLAASMIGDRRPIDLVVHAHAGTACAGQAVSIGLIVTELVINALKHAFPGELSAGTVIVAYERVGPSWRLTVCDDGIGNPAGESGKEKPGLGTTIIKALAKQLEAQVEIAMDANGTKVTLTHASQGAQLPQAA
jgi:two-component sensor histidine kinase